jgi:hypothetical protein
MSIHRDLDGTTERDLGETARFARMGSAAIVVFDIDGVLADGCHREHFLAVKPRDWASFFATLGDDAPIAAGIERLIELRRLNPCVLLSGRPEHTRAATITWLESNGIAGLPVYLRPDRDYRPAPQFKVEALAGLGGPTAMRLVIDDDERVVGALLDAGYPAEHFTG